VEPLYEHVARRAQEWNTLGNVGLVVGATYPQALQRARAAAPDLWILVPGVGAQGGDLDASVRNGLRADGSGIIVSASRAIARASDARAEAARLRDAINASRH
jgi:uridine monophosphate synthetase